MTEQVTTTCAVGQRDGNVVLEFPSAVQYAAFDPETAKQVGMAMAKEAYHIHTGTKPGNNARIITEEIRTKLCFRASHIIKSMSDKKKLPLAIATQVVDSILAEIT